MNKNNLPIYFSFAVIFGILIGTFFTGNTGNLFSLKTAKEAKIKRLINYIENEYVDNINTDNLLDGAIKQMLEKLDPHSVYIPRENLQAVKENMQGNFVGIGIQFRMIKDSVTVIQTIKGGPSIKAGIKAGDRILIANKDTLFGKKINSSSIPSYLKGKPNTKVNLKIYRKTNDSIFSIKLTRGKVNIKSVDVAYMLKEEIGYIKLNRFANNTYKEFKKSLNKLQKNGMKTLVMDLRGNGGGFVHIANKIADEFLEDNLLIVFTKNNKGTIQKSFSTEKGSFEKGKLYVLIDENSASASEILAGALQDNDKGTIVGRRSFGKGLVQQEMALGDGSAVRLTTARYYTPTGRSIQKPYKKSTINTTVNYNSDLEERYKNGELFNKDSIKINKELQYKTKKGKIVYGGGGIVPDIFVAIDTTNLTNLYFGTINQFSFDYVDSNRKKLAKYTIDNYLETFDKEGKVLNKFLDKFKDFNLSTTTKNVVKYYIKAAVASDLFGDEGFYRVIHANDAVLKKVRELESKN